MTSELMMKQSQEIIYIESWVYFKVEDFLFFFFLIFFIIDFFI